MSIKNLYAKSGVVIAGIGLFFGWLLRAILQPAFDITNVPAYQLLTEIGLVTAAATHPYVFVGVSVLATLLAIETHHLRAWVHVAVTTTTVVAVSYLLKELFAIPRPAHGLIELGSYGFPSTHGAAVGSIFVVGLFHSWRLCRTQWLFFFTAVLATILTAVAAFSRVLINVHTFGDVVAGLLVGIGLGAVAVQLWTNKHQS